MEVSCPEVLAEETAMEVAEAFGIGVEMVSSGFCFYLDGDEAQGRWEPRLTRLIEDVRSRCSSPGEVVYDTSLVVDEGWADRWKEHFKPLRVGSRFVICPTWESVEAGPRDLVILMDPGRAFGTGHHETTRLCLEQLESIVHNGMDDMPGSLLDVGTGSGILAIGGALLGFDPVLGVDVDGEAVEVARENISLNKLTCRIELRTGSVRDVPGRFRVVVANIQAHPLVELAGPLIQRLEPGGRLLLSGILLEQEQHVREAYEAWGGRFRSLERQGEWCLLLFERL